MIRVWLLLARFLLWLRYRVRILGLDAIRRKGKRGILFLPNHPALIDPILLLSRLWGPFRVRALADRRQIDRFLIRRLARNVNVLPIEESFHGAYAPEEIQAALDKCVRALQNGENLLLYPSGHVYRSRGEDLGANSAVSRILSAIPDVRVVLIRTRGLWGSRFSWAEGQEPNIPRVLLRGAGILLAGGVFFAPRREVTVELVEPDDLPRRTEKNALNRYLETFYNADAPPNTYVPFTHWEKGGPRVMPEPQRAGIEGDPAAVPPATRTLVLDFLQDLTGAEELSDKTRLSHDLGMDSMSGMELVSWLQTEFGVSISDFATLRTVGDVLLTACGEAVSSGAVTLRPVAAAWSRRGSVPDDPEHLTEMTIPQALLAQARRQPRRVVLADQTGGERTYRELVLGCLALQEPLRSLPGERLGVMMPAGVAAAMLLPACHFAGKTPAFVNWTLGPRNLNACLDAAGVQKILTARALVETLDARGVDLSAVRSRFVFLEDLRRTLPRRAKLAAYLRSRFRWEKLDRAARSAPDIAVILFTSGSESRPKAVPLTHRNLLTNLIDGCRCFHLRPDDRLLGILPPFHSFGLTTSVVLPLTVGLRCAYWPDPTHGAAMGKMIDAYDITMLAGAPTFLHGIVRASTNEQLRTLRLVISGGEACSPRVYEALARRCPQTIVLEGYGATECSPIISVNAEDDPRPGTIGKVLSSLEYALVDPDAADAEMRRVPPGREGMLLVRGPSVFAGYLNADAPCPFVSFEGENWYRTGDLVVADADGVLTFAGRRKRFVKIGGEMISLPAIEAVLAERLARDDDDGPILAVAATPEEEHPEIVLFTTRPITREQANEFLRAAGLSGLHNLRRVVRLEELPLLGTGKCDYRTLTQRLGEGNFS